MRVMGRLRKIIMSLVTFIILMSVLTGCSLFPVEEVLQEPPLISPPSVEYKFYRVEKGDISRVASGTGIVESFYYTAEKFQFTKATVKNSNVREGQTVSQGQVLLTIDTSDAQNRIAIAEGKITQLKSKLIEYTKRVAQGQTSAEDLRDIQREMDVYTYDYNKSKEILQYSSVKASLSGIVTYINPKCKQAPFAISQGDVLFGIDSNDTKYKYVTFKKAQEAIDNPDRIPTEFKVGNVLDLTIKTSSKTQIIKGEVVSREYVLEQTGKTDVPILNYYLKMSTISSSIKKGDTVQFNQVVQTANNVLIINKKCVFDRNKMRFVYYLDLNGLKMEKPIISGIESTEGMIEVLEGLNVGDLILIE